MKNRSFFLVLSFLSIAFFRANSQELFKELSESESGIGHVFGKLPHAGLEGGGVAVGDLDGDNLPDIFLVGDSLHGLYQNKGELQFENVFSESGIKPFRGATSVLIYDINADGKNDILIGRRSVSNNPLYQMMVSDPTLEKTESNLLVYLNQGGFKFKMASNYSIKTQQAVSGMALADFDKNGFPDLLISSWDVDFSKVNSSLLSVEALQKAEETPAQLFMQIEKGVFEEKAFEMGLKGGSTIKSSFSVAATDLNNDGWVDIIISNDFDIPDRTFINQDGKSFEEMDIQQAMSFYSMGMDAADLTNDGRIDFMISDMRPTGYYRQKTVKYEKLFEWNNMTATADIKKQNVRNTLFVNNGNLHFSEIGQMINADATDWSWSVLLADFDNNEHKDIFISNGYFYQEFFKFDTPLYFDSMRRAFTNLSHEDFLIRLQKRDTITAEHFKNFYFSNKGNLDFENVSESWRKSKALNTRGAAYADFDLDGDLDLVLNNAKQKSVILENLSKANYLRVQLKSKELKVLLHAKVKAFYDGKIQLQELNPCRGFHSSSESILHFGLGEFEKLDSLVIHWPNGKQSKLENVSANQVLEVFFEDQILEQTRSEKSISFFEETELPGLDFKHKENDYNDLEDYPLLPKMYSREGPSIAVDDLNGDELEDIVIGASAGFSTRIYYQNKKGAFELDTLCGLQNEAWQEDGNVLIFDFDSDGDIDLYIASGGSEELDGADFYQDRLYENIGKGKFKKKDLLPKIESSTGVVKMTYLKADSTEPILFVGGRLKAGFFPKSPKSYLLKYNGEKFEDVTERVAPGLSEIGMVTDAVWSDFNQDNLIDLIVVGEYMSPKFFQNNNGQFKNVSNTILPNDSLNGFWNCIETGDFNQDGRVDFALGNAGLNTRYKASYEYPLKLFAYDFDHNSYMDIITAYYEDGRLYPTKMLNALKNRLAGFSKKYYKHSTFAASDVYSIFDSVDLINAQHLKVHTTSSVLLLNKPDGTYQAKELPVESQVGPVQDFLKIDYNNDENLDLLLVGNFYPIESQTGAYTAFSGLLLESDKYGNFYPVDSGFLMNGDCKEIEIIQVKKKTFILVSRNGESMKVFSVQKK